MVKISTPNSSNATFEIISVILRSMSKKSDVTSSFEAFEKDVPYLANKIKDDKEPKNEFTSSTPCSSSSYSFTSIIVPVIVADAIILKEQIISLTRAIKGHSKHVQE